jgi:hypothetical protein
VCRLARVAASHGCHDIWSLTPEELDYLLEKRMMVVQHHEKMTPADWNFQYGEFLDLTAGEQEPFSNPRFAALWAPPAPSQDTAPPGTVVPWSPALPVPGEMPPPPPIDPRRPFAREYEAAAKWYDRPQPAPVLASNGAKGLDKGEDSDGLSWSASPKRAAAAAAAAQEEASSKGLGAAGQSAAAAAARTAVDASQKDIFAPAAPKHDTFARQASGATAVGASLHSVPENAGEKYDGPPLELEEGFFEVKLPNGTTHHGQYGRLLSLVRSGEVPPGWPAHRDADGLWLPLRGETGPLYTQNE